MKQRITTGVLGGAGLLFVLWMGGWWYAGSVILLATIGYAEYCRMKKVALYTPQALVGFGLLWVLLFSGLAEGKLISAMGILTSPNNIILGLVLFFVLIVWSRNRFQIDEMSYLFVGSLYIGYGFSYMIQTRFLEEGFIWSLFIFIITFTNDTGAYFTGKRFGRRKLWPIISPNKTIEGSLGGFFFSLVMGVTMAFIFPQLGSVWAILLLSALIAIVGPVGDLVESAIKRTNGVKDTGTLLPGHGGILDRFDSLLLVFPVLHLFQLI